MTTIKTALVPLAQGCEELEAITIMDILVRGGVNVIRASLDDQKLIQASRGTHLVADVTLSSIAQQTFDLIALPGGLPGADYLNADERLRHMIQQQNQAKRWLGAICAAPKVFVSAGILDNKQATSYPGVIDKFPAKGMTYVDQPVVQDGHIITSQGPATAMAFALTLVEVLKGKAVKEKVKKELLYFKTFNNEAEIS